jgi:LysR family transcriptional regulator, hca operon transcriptional activator
MLQRLGRSMELRHLRYFVAVAETGSLTLAAEKRLHTAQPSLSRQIRDLEREVGVQLLNRSPQGTELTAAGQAFLDHARLSLAQADAAAEAARRAAQPERAIFSLGFLTGQELDWLPHAPGILRDELPKIEIRVSSGFSTDLADDLERGKLDIAFMRTEPKPDLEYKLVRKEPLVVILPSDHPLTGNQAIDPRDLPDETFVGISDVAPVLRSAIKDYLTQSGVEIVPTLEVDNYAMAMSLVTSKRGMALLPASIEGYLPWSITSRPLAGERPTVDLVVGYHKANTSPILKKFLSRIDDLSTRIYGKARAE